MMDANIPYYVELREIGEGAFGRALLVAEAKENNQYVIKEIKVPESNPDAKRKRLEFINNEAKILTEIDNKYIVKSHQSFFKGNKFNLVMDYLEGKN